MFWLNLITDTDVWNNEIKACNNSNGNAGKNTFEDYVKNTHNIFSFQYSLFSSSIKYGQKTQEYGW